jgi:site-specific DNA-methyltransferase (adenine-specific)
MSVRIIQGDCRSTMAAAAPYDMILADPPYGQTSLAWDQRVPGWERIAATAIKPTGSMWVFGSMRLLAETWADLEEAGWKYAQDIVWEKHNGTNLAADRFRRVHEHVVQFYRRDTPWAAVYNEVQTTPDATARTVRKKGRPAQWIGATGETVYESQDGGPRLMRSVLQVRSCHGSAIHPTEKPLPLLEIMLRTSCPPGGLVGDFFAGSGAVAEACIATGRNYFGAEIDPVYYEGSTRRLRLLADIAE